MATIDDFGGTADPLNAPPLGGPTGWAAAVRDYLKDSVVQIAGGVMSGSLTVPRVKLNTGGLAGPILKAESATNAQLTNLAEDALATLEVDTPKAAAQAANKNYVDAIGGFHYLDTKTARVIGQAGIYNECGITVAPGAWLVQCGVAIYRADVVGAWCAIGAPGLVANTAGERVVGGGAGYWTLRSALTVISVGANTNLFPYLWTEGGSDISIPGTGSGPAGWISAIRLRN
jgi:hypothetical protein